MVWIVGAVCMILFGATLGVIGLSLDYVGVCNNGWDHVAGWHISAGVLSARGPGKHIASPLGRGGWVQKNFLTPTVAFSWSASRLRRRNFTVSGGNVA